MTRQDLNRLSGIAPVILSLLGFAIILVVVTTGWERHLPDEGAAAHLFQLLVVAQVPLFLLFLWTADWTRKRTIVAFLVCQAAALLLALGSLAFFRL